MKISARRRLRARLLHVKRWETTVAGEDVVLMVTDAAQPNKHLVICTISMGGPEGSNPRELLVKKLALGTPVKDEPPGKGRQAQHCLGQGCSWHDRSH